MFALQSAGSIFRTYNLILDQAADCDELEALVVVHEDAELLDEDLCDRLRRVLRDSAVGVIGCVGAVGVRNIAWWEGSAIMGSYVHRYGELGGGEFRAFGDGGNGFPDNAHDAKSDTIYGLMMAFSPWTVRHIRFDESLGPNWGYDFDYCLQVRAAGRKVVTADIDVAHQHSLALVTDPEAWMLAHVRAAEKWIDHGPHPGATEGDWKLRARRAEAEAVIARLQAAGMLLQADAHSAAQARRMRELTDTASWRVTEPLRRLNAVRKQIQQRSRS